MSARTVIVLLLLLCSSCARHSSRTVPDGLRAAPDRTSRSQVPVPGGAAPVPEPSTFILVGLGLAALGVACRRKSKRSGQ